MNRCTGDLRKDDTGHKLTDGVACKGKKQSTGKVCVISLNLLIVSCKVVSITDQGLLITGKRRNLLTESIERCSEDDTEDVRDRQDDDCKGIVRSSRLTGNLLVDL